MSDFLCPRIAYYLWYTEFLMFTLVTDSQMFFFQASFGGTSPDPHSIIWHGGEG